MTEIRFTSTSTVALIDSMGSDARIAQAARVSTLAEDAAEHTGNDAGLIRYLMKNRHGSPFEHNAMTFLVTAPLFVFYEWHRHRVGFSYNEESGRYRELRPVFYVTAEERPLTQVGKQAAYTLESGTHEQQAIVQFTDRKAAVDAWSLYQERLAAGVAKEVARNVLPVSLMKTMYVTCNARSLMSLLSLRTDNEQALFKSKPLWEFARVADMLELHGGKLFPETMEAFNEFGRVSP